MDSIKILAAGFVVLLAAGGVAAADGGAGALAITGETGSINDADVDATSENGTVTLTLVDEGDGVANATVDVKREYQHEYDDQDGESDNEYDGRESESDHAHERVGTTDANGSVSFVLSPENESRNVTALEVELEKGSFSGELTYRVENGSLVLIDESYEYEEESADRENNDTASYNESKQMSVGMSDARDIAADTLNESSQGRWRLVEADTHPGDNYYKFEYVLIDADQSGEAEIRIDGSTGGVIKYEQEIEGEGEREYEDDEDENEGDEQGDEDKTDEREDGREIEDENETDDENEQEPEDEDEGDESSDEETEN
ncbi:MAG: hypothetical protein ABEI27_04475 [Halobellus sp.]|uniref:hypothetical protein n=1 Tax=Halobellus sp. TaxID=1979212 RepID=UPI0035D50A63